MPARPEPDDRAARLKELLAKADEAAQRIAAQETERQASSEYAARIEREEAEAMIMQARVKAGWVDEAALQPAAEEPQPAEDETVPQA